MMPMHEKTEGKTPMLCSQRPELNTDTEERPHTHTTQHIPWRDRGYVQAVEVMQEDIMRWCTRVSKSESIEEIADDDIRNTIQTEVHRRPSKIPKVRSDGKLPRPTMHGVNERDCYSTETEPGETEDSHGPCCDGGSSTNEHMYMHSMWKHPPQQ